MAEANPAEGANVMMSSHQPTPARPDENGGTIVAEAIDGTVVLSVAGLLDADAGGALLAALDAALAVAPDRVEVDLAGVADFTPEGLDALQSCRDFSFRLADGLHYRTVPGPGQAAFLAAFE
jgi:hypothetical protein